MLPYDQSGTTEQAQFTYSSLAKAFEKQTKIIEDQGIKQVEALKALKSEENKRDIKPTEEVFLEDTKTNETKNEIDEITEVLLVHYNIVNNSYQQNSRVLFKFVPNTFFGQLLNTSRQKKYF